jgi:hypothetical protein
MTRYIQVDLHSRISLAEASFVLRAELAAASVRLAENHEGK